MLTRILQIIEQNSDVAKLSFEQKDQEEKGKHNSESSSAVDKDKAAVREAFSRLSKSPDQGTGQLSRVFNDFPHLLDEKTAAVYADELFAITQQIYTNDLERRADDNDQYLRDDSLSAKKLKQFFIKLIGRACDALLGEDGALKPELVKALQLDELIKYASAHSPHVAAIKQQLPVYLICSLWANTPLCGEIITRCTDRLVASRDKNNVARAGILNNYVNKYVKNPSDPVFLCAMALQNPRSISRDLSIATTTSAFEERKKEWEKVAVDLYEYRTKPYQDAAAAVYQQLILSEFEKVKDDEKAFAQFIEAWHAYATSATDIETIKAADAAKVATAKVASAANIAAVKAAKAVAAATDDSAKRAARVVSDNADEALDDANFAAAKAAKIASTANTKKEIAPIILQEIESLRLERDLTNTLKEAKTKGEARTESKSEAVADVSLALLDRCVFWTTLADDYMRRGNKSVADTILQKLTSFMTDKVFLPALKEEVDPKIPAPSLIDRQLDFIQTQIEKAEQLQGGKADTILASLASMTKQIMVDEHARAREQKQEVANAEQQMRFVQTWLERAETLRGKKQTSKTKTPLREKQADMLVKAISSLEVSAIKTELAKISDAKAQDEKIVAWIKQIKDSPYPAEKEIIAEQLLQFAASDLEKSRFDDNLVERFDFWATHLKKADPVLKNKLAGLMEQMKAQAEMAAQIIGEVALLKLKKEVKEVKEETAESLLKKGFEFIDARIKKAEKMQSAKAEIFLVSLFDHMGKIVLDIQNKERAKEQKRQEQFHNSRSDQQMQFVNFLIYEAEKLKKNSDKKSDVFAKVISSLTVPAIKEELDAIKEKSEQINMFDHWITRKKNVANPILKEIIAEQLCQFVMGRVGECRQNKNKEIIDWMEKLKKSDPVLKVRFIDRLKNEITHPMVLGDIIGAEDDTQEVRAERVRKWKTVRDYFHKSDHAFSAITQGLQRYENSLLTAPKGQFASKAVPPPSGEHKAVPPSPKKS